MKKGTYSSVQIFLICLLLFLGVMLVATDNPVDWTESGTECTFLYIEPGDYTLSVSCIPSDGENRIIVYSDAATAEDGTSGVLFEQVSLEPGQDGATIPLTLEQGVFSVTVATDLDTEDFSLVTSANLRSNHIIYRDGLFLGILCMIAAAVLAVVFVRVSGEKYRFPLLAILIGLAAGIPLYVEVALDGHDFTFHLLRIEGLYRAMASGDFPVRINPMQISGYGHLSSTMYPQLFLYPIALLRFLNVSLMTCYKLLLTAVNVGTALIAYYAVKNITKSDKIGMAMSLLYTLSAYRLVCIYVRAALGEALAMAFLPLVIWGVYECLWGQKRWKILTLGMTGVLGSHILSVEMCVLFMGLELIWWLCSKRKNDMGKRILAGVKAGVTTALLNLSFLVPFLYFSSQDLKCYGMANSIANSVVYFSQMFSLTLSTAGISMPRGETRGDMSLSVGPALLLGLIAFFWWSGKKDKNDKNDDSLKRIGIHCAAYAVLGLLLSSWLMPWGAVIERISLVEKLTAPLQFVWRFLGPASAFLSVCAAVGLVKLSEERKELNWLFGVVVTLCLVSAWTLFDNLKEFEKVYANPMAMVAAKDVDELYLYNESSGTSYTREEAIPVTAGGTRAVYSGYKKQGTHISFDVTPLETAQDRLIIPLYYYPGYEVKVNGEKVEALCADNHLVACELPSEQAHIDVRYAGLPLFRVGDIVSLVTMVGIIGKFLVYFFRRICYDVKV